MIKKCSSLQFSLIFIVSAASVAVNLMPICFIEESGDFGIVSALLSLPLIAFITALFCRYSESFIYKTEELSEKAEPLFKFFKIILAFWLIFLIAAKISQFYERVSSVAFSFLPKAFCIGSFLLICSLGAVMGYRTFAGFAQCAFIALCIVFAAIALFSAKDFHFDNFSLINSGSGYSVIKSLIYPIELFSYFPIFLIMHKNTDLRDLKRQKPIIIISMALLIFLVTAFTLGIFGSELTKSLAFPFFSMLKSAKLSGSVEHLQTVFVSFWITVDFVYITMLFLCVTQLLGDSLKLKKGVEKMIPPIIAAVAFLINIIPIADTSAVSDINYRIIPLVNFIPVALYIFALIIHILMRKAGRKAVN